MIQIAHQGRPRIASCHSLSRTPHIDIDQSGSSRFSKARCFRHPMGFTTCNLHDVLINAASLCPQPGFFRASDKIIRGNHFGHHKGCPKPTRDPTKNMICHTGHRRQNRPPVYDFITNFDIFQIMHKNKAAQCIAYIIDFLVHCKTKSFRPPRVEGSNCASTLPCLLT